MNPYLFPWMIPMFPSNCDKPPTVYSILESIVNYGTDDKQKIRDLAKYGRATIFNFDYPLSVNIKKENFECMILNHYLMRRINYDTVTAFNIMLNAKLNEIMPKYNKLFDSLENWDIFNDGETITRDETDSGTNNTNTTNNQTMNTSNESNTTQNNTSDRRNSQLPQNELANVRDGKYVSDYDYDSNNATAQDTSTSTSTNSQTGTNNNTTSNTRHSKEVRTPLNKIEIYKQMQEDIKSIYSMIFEDLDCLFYGLV